MGRYIVAAVLLGSYAVAAAWVIRGEGKAYRAARAREKDGPARLASAPKDVAGPSKPAPPPAEARAVEPAPAPPVETTTVVVANVEPPAPRPAATTPAPAAVAPTPPPPSIPAATAAKPDPFWITDRMKRVWDPTTLGSAEERDLGRALHEVILERNRPQTSGPYLQRAEKAAEPLLESGVRKDISYTFTILDSDAVNAFSHPGGYIYLTRGLFEFIGADEDQDFVLQFVIGHEIAHVELKHAIKCLQDPDLKNSKLGTLPQFLLFILPLGYPDAQDFEADRWAFDRMTSPRLDRSRHEALAFLRRLKGYAERNEFENGRTQLRPDPGAAPIDNHLRAHPAAYKRLGKLTAPAPAATPAR